MALSFKQKIVVSFLAMGIVPMVISSGISLYLGANEEINLSFDKLEVGAKSKAAAIADYMNLVIGHVRSLANDHMVTDGMMEFDRAYKAFDPNAVVVDERSLRERYEYQAANTPGAPAGSVERWMPEEGKSKALQQLYITKNPEKIGEKDNFWDAKDGSEYSRVHEELHQHFRHFLKEFGYYDVFLINPDGQIVYTVFKEVDYMTNLVTGPYANTALGRAFKRAKEANKPGTVIIEDFDPYEPSYNAAASFYAVPIYDDYDVKNGLLGVLAIQAPIDKINAIFGDSKKFGDTVDSFIVGKDLKFHSKPTVLKVNIGDSLGGGLKTMVEGFYAEGISGKFMAFNGMDGTELWGAIEKVDIPGLEWAVVMRESKAEVMESVYHLVWILLGVMAISAVVTTFIGLYMGRTLVEPIQRLARNFFQGAEKVGVATGQVGEAVSSMVAASEETSAQSKVIRKNSTEASGYVSSVSTAVEELNVSINDISQSIGETNVLIDDAVQKAKKTDEVVRSLGEASKKITEVVSLINDLAEQTNLLALNAAIEAARAGDAGRGFAVVADEVKKLASNTSQATEDIKEQVSEIQTVSEQSVVALHAVVEAIHKIRDNATTVSAAVEEQSGVAKQISGSVRDAANRVQQVDENMNGIEQAANDTSVAADQVNGSSQEVQGAFGEMKTGMQKALDEIGVKA